MSVRDAFTIMLREHARLEHEFQLENPRRFRCWMKYRQQRILWAAQYCVHRWPGDLVEIGAWEGHTTIMLCQLARQFGRRVIAIDPWITGLQNCEDDTYAKFLERTAEYRDLIDEIHLPSEDPEVLDYIKGRELCFAYVDGRHKHDFVFRDIQTVSHCKGVIVCDDIDDMHYAATGFSMGALAIGRELLHIPPMIEGYILPPETTSPSMRDLFMDRVLSRDMIEKEKARLDDNPHLLDNAPQCSMYGYYRERIQRAAEIAATYYPGVMVEIGCWRGGTTKHILQVADKYNRRVIAIDPWVHPVADREADYQHFLKNTAPWKDRLTILRSRSQDQDVIKYLEDLPICFAFVDGEHTHPAAATDLKTVSHAAIIAVDDLYYRHDQPQTAEVRRAFWEAAREQRREMLYYSNFSDGYLMPREGK